MKSTQELFSLQGKTAIVTGALGLIGKKHCEALSVAGATVVVADINELKAIAFAESLKDGRSFGIGIDVTNKDRIQVVRDTILSKTGSIEILVNNAAINDMVENPDAAAEMSKFENYPLDLFRKVLDVNVTGMFLCSQEFGTEMAKQSKGSIINVASTYGIVGPDQSIYIKPDGTQPFFKSPAYPTTKGAVINFTRYLAAYWGKCGVRVNTLSPGGVENGQDAYFIQNYANKTPLGRMAQPNDYQGALVFLASDSSMYMTGANVVVDGGWTAW